MPSEKAVDATLNTLAQNPRGARSIAVQRILTVGSIPAYYLFASSPARQDWCTDKKVLTT